HTLPRCNLPSAIRADVPWDLSPRVLSWLGQPREGSCGELSRASAGATTVRNDSHVVRVFAGSRPSSDGGKSKTTTEAPLLGALGYLKTVDRKKRGLTCSGR